MLTLTAKAKDRLRVLLSEGERQDSGLRVQIVPGGCSGFEYDLSVGAAAEGDQVIDEDGVRVIVDRSSLSYLDGVELDYEDGFQGAGFLINNPNAAGSCGCGKSFTA